MESITLKLNQIGAVGTYLLIVIICSVSLCFYFSKKRKENITSFMSKWTHTANGNFVLVGVSIIWASIVSVFGSQLQQQWFGGTDWGIETFIFGTSVALTLILSFLHYIQSQEKELQSYTRPTYEAIKENSTQCLNLMKVINDCIQDFKFIEAKESNKRGIVFDDESEREKFNTSMDKAIETAIQSVLLITKRSIDGYDDLHLKANIFNLINSSAVYSGLSKESDNNNSIFNAKAVTSSPFFLFSTNLQARLESCDFILVCEKTCTCQLDKKNKFSNCYNEGIDKEAEPLCMPFTLKHHDAKMNHPNLFGAPYAALNNHEVYVRNIIESVNDYISDLRKSPQFKEHMNDHYERAIRNYYEKDSDKPKSLISFPIYSIEIDPIKISTPFEGKSVICVFNIYANRVNFLENDLKAESLYALLKPIFHMLGVLISLKKLYIEKIRCYNESNI
ncbi:TPA: hypothetical protein PCI20_001072 [Klebsiella pneumoniae]|uniref:hypothetical protein n=1 Tax=Enterobacteriaceae TaxID=543 RepID=UPI002005F98D|nr:hypothetical protein [Enterobacter bugandensis]MCK7390339.1 hypothetical protein [Enterobacter bugandensis]HCM9187110.1 hypothetical protein [Enterobacter hormaechei subsp. xiangfangensis]HDG7400496.1 hypothetical protein [Klebsiella pneumoniae]